MPEMEKRYAYLAARKAGEAIRGSIKLEHTHSGFGNEAISLPTTLHTFIPPRPLLPISNQRLPIPHLPPPFASNRRAQWNFSARSRVRKGNFPRDNDQSPSRGIYSEEADEIKKRKRKQREKERAASRETGQPARKRDVRH